MQVPTGPRVDVAGGNQASFRFTNPDLPFPAGSTGVAVGEIDAAARARVAPKFPVPPAPAGSGVANPKPQRDRRPVRT